jgi:hypothetical protein
MNARQLVRLFSSTAAAGLLFCTSSAYGAIAHWSFDAATITTDADGIVTAADQTGNHNATRVKNGTGVNVTSVAGQFGEAADYNNGFGAQATNNASFSFPQLYEIMGATAGDFSVAAWAKVPDNGATAWDDNPILIDWGNAPTGTNRFTYWFQLDNVDTNAALRPRAQIRNSNSPPSATNIDIIATTLSSAQAGTAGGPTVFDDGVWHHLAWTWTKSTGEMRFYTDGVLRHTQTSTQPLANRDLLISDSPVGALGGKRDNNRFFRGAMDEVWVFGKAINAAEVLLLQTTNANVPEPSSLILAAMSLLALRAVRSNRK